MHGFARSVDDRMTNFWRGLDRTSAETARVGGTEIDILRPFGGGDFLHLGSGPGTPAEPGDNHADAVAIRKTVADGLHEHFCRGIPIARLGGCLGSDRERPGGM